MSEDLFPVIAFVGLTILRLGVPILGIMLVGTAVRRVRLAMP